MHGKTRKILLVEDDEDVRGALAALLVGEGYEVVEAAHGAEALERLRASNFCLILLDLMMPVMNGWQFRAEQLKDPALASVPVGVVTADNGAAQKAAEVGAVGYLLKPIELPDLLAHVERCC